MHNTLCIIMWMFEASYNYEPSRLPKELCDCIYTLPLGPFSSQRSQSSTARSQSHLFVGNGNVRTHMRTAPGTPGAVPGTPAPGTPGAVLMCVQGTGDQKCLYSCSTCIAL